MNGYKQIFVKMPAGNIVSLMNDYKQIFVKMPAWNTLTFDIDNSTTVRDLKKFIPCNLNIYLNKSFIFSMRN